MSIAIHCKYDELVSVKSLKPHPDNRNKHPKEQIERLAELIEYQGVRLPIVVSKQSGFIAKGHGTLLAEIHLGMKEVPVVYQDFESDDQEYAFVQSDNAIAAWASLDLPAINLDIPKLGPMNIDLLGIKNLKVDPSEKSKNEINDKDQFIVSIKCKDENEMAEIFEEMKERGFECKLIT